MVTPYVPSLPGRWDRSMANGFSLLIGNASQKCSVGFVVLAGEKGDFFQLLRQQYGIRLKLLSTGQLWLQWYSSIS